jgi:uncharacterized lipoprotein YajG
MRVSLRNSFLVLAVSAVMVAGCSKPTPQITVSEEPRTTAASAAAAPVEPGLLNTPQ